MYCKHCGKQIDDNSEYCRYCGTDLSNKVLPGIPNITTRYKKLICLGVLWIFLSFASSEGWICGFLVSAFLIPLTMVSILYLLSKVGKFSVNLLWNTNDSRKVKKWKVVYYLASATILLFILNDSSHQDRNYRIMDLIFGSVFLWGIVTLIICVVTLYLKKSSLSHQTQEHLQEKNKKLKGYLCKAFLISFTVLSVIGMVILGCYIYDQIMQPEQPTPPEINNLMYESTCPDDHHPHMIDLGLPSGTKWACCNVGASKPEEFGGYYAWGEVDEKSNYNDVNYSHSKGDDNNGDGFYDKDERYENLGSCISGTQYDVAYVKLGKLWQMPNKEQFKELNHYCTNELVVLNDIRGCKFRSKKNGKSIFLPAADSYYGPKGSVRDNCGYYWAGTMAPASEGAYYLYFCSDYVEVDYHGFLNMGHSVRAVAK